MGVREQDLTYSGQGGDPVDAFLVAPEGAGEPSPGIVLIHEVFGLDRHMRAVARRFAGEGYAVLAPDLYSREGLPGPESTEEDPAPSWDVETIRAAVQGLPDRRALADLDLGVAFLADLEEVAADRIAAVGFCMGGNLAFQLGCTSMRISAVVDFYGRPVYAELSAEKPIQPIELALNLDRPLLAFFGERDQGIPPEQVERLRQALSAGAKSFEIVTYPGAGHGFFNDLRPGYHESSALDAWQRTLAFLVETN